MGVLGVSFHEAHTTHVNDIRLALAARYAYDAERERQTLRGLRAVAYVGLQPHLRKGSKIAPEDLFTIPGETAPEAVKPISSITDLSEAQRAWVEKSRQRGQ